jgi:hypothetical protein
MSRVVVILKAKLKEAGFEVLEIEYYPPRKRDEQPEMHVTVQARYARPTHRAVIDQAIAMWAVMLDSMDFTVPGAPDTQFVAGQLWQHFVLILEVPAAVYAVFRPAYNAAATAEARDAALEALMAKSQFAVFDINHDEYVDEKNFTDKYFARERRRRL